MKKENQILSSWEINANAWEEILSKNQIASREITNPAIISAIHSNCSGKILDMGCGEGWLSRSLSELGFETFGLDATQPLIEMAKKKSAQLSFDCISFEEIINWNNGTHSCKTLSNLAQKPADAAVFNFCLYEESGVVELFLGMKKLIKPKGKIFIQTIHPITMLGMGLNYQSQWLEDAWKGLPGSFVDGHPWFFRTFENWLNVFHDSGIIIQKLYEPSSKEAKQPASIIFVLSVDS